MEKDIFDCFFVLFCKSPTFWSSKFGWSVLLLLTVRDLGASVVIIYRLAHRDRDEDVMHVIYTSLENFLSPDSVLDTFRRFCETQSWFSISLLFFAAGKADWTKCWVKP